jgi:hypothetical protein
VEVDPERRDHHHPNSENQNEPGETAMNAKTTKGGARYDGELQMFCETAHEPNQETLRFLRWMVEQGRLEHDAAGPASGEYAGEILGEAA